MVTVIKIKKEFAQRVKQILEKNNWLNSDHIIGRTARYVLLPVTEDFSENRFADIPHSLEERNLEKRKVKRVKTIKDALKKVVPASKFEFVKNSFDIVGDIVVLEIPDELESMEKSIGWAVKRMLPNIKVVAKKSKRTAGKYRIRKILFLVGEKRSETLHKESEMLLKVDLNKVYYSSRMGAERLRILKQVKNKEDILVMFGGIGPYAILFAKNRNVNVWVNEWNPDALKLIEENIRMNHVRDKVKIVPGDAVKSVPKLKQKFDRIVMVLPEKAHEFLRVALNASKKGSIIHIYQFVQQNDFKKRGSELVDLCKQVGKPVKLLRTTKSGYYSPRVYRVCYDLRVL